MTSTNQPGSPGSSRLLACHLKAGDDGLNCDSIMLCELVDGVIQSISLRVDALWDSGNRVSKRHRER